MKSILTTIIILVNFSINYAQTVNEKTWSLEQCIDSALMNNYAIHASNIKLDIASVKVKNARYGYLPSLDGGATHGYNWGQTIDPFTNQFASSRVQYNNFYLSSSLVLFSGLQNYYSQKIVEIDWESQVYNKQIEERNLKIQVATSYLQVLLNDEIYLAYEEQLKLTRVQKERITNLIESEREPKHKLFEILAQEETDKYYILKAQNDLNYSLLLLQQLMNMSYQTNFKITRFDTLSPSKSINESINISSFPELKMSELTIQKQVLSEKSTIGNLFPTLSVNGSLGSGYSENNKYLTPTGELLPKPFSTQVNENFYQSASLTLTIPIFNKNTTGSQIQINKLKLEELKLNIEEQKLDIQNKVERLKMAIENTNSQFLSLKAVTKVSEIYYKNSLTQFENGVITNAKLQEVKNGLFREKSNLIQMKYQIIANNLILEFYLNSIDS